MVRIHPDPPNGRPSGTGAVAQLGERLLCKQEAVGSIPSSSTSQFEAKQGKGRHLPIDCAPALSNEF